jgi:hypothetical protein
MIPSSPSLSIPLNHTGHVVLQLELDSSLPVLIEQERWNELDAWMSHSFKSGEIAAIVDPLGPFTTKEHILALRSAPDDEEGIWHDDGSRNLAFSLGLNLRPQTIEGGVLRLRQKGRIETEVSFPALAYGTMVLFLTGSSGWEHKVDAVTAGKRLICAGWLTL